MPLREEQGLSEVFAARALFYRFAAPVSGLAVFLLMSWLYLRGDKALYLQILGSWGIKPFRFPFVDISGSLAAWECARHGIGVILSDPCDVLHRPYNYSPLWMAFSAIPLGVKDTPVVGWTTDLLFLLSLALLPRPRRPLELLLVLAATLSTMVAFALERANPDVLLFVMLLGAAFLAERGLGARLLGYSLVILAALIKYYPIVALVILFRERLNRFIAIALLVLAVFLVFGISYSREIAEGMPTIAHGAYATDLFAAENLPIALGRLMRIAVAGWDWAALAGRVSGTAIYLLLVACGIAISRRLLRWGEFRTAIGELGERERLLLVVGSSVMTGCFFAGQSIGYRGVYFLLVLPGLLAAARSAAGRSVRRLLTGAVVSIVALMWEECVRLALYRWLAHAHPAAGAVFEVKIAFLIMRELAWWWVVSVMAAILADFIVRAELWAEGRSLLRRLAIP